MGKYKIIKDVTINKIPVFKVGEVVEGIEKPVDTMGRIFVIAKLDKETSKKFNNQANVQFVLESPKYPLTVQATRISNNNESEQSADLPEDLQKKARKIQIGVAIAGWSIFGLLAYKFWNKSKFWKAGIITVGAINVYNTYKIFSKSAITIESKSKDEKIVSFFKNLESNPPKSEKEAEERAAKFGLNRNDIDEYNKRVNNLK